MDGIGKWVDPHRFDLDLALEGMGKPGLQQMMNHHGRRHESGERVKHQQAGENPEQHFMAPIPEQGFVCHMTALSCVSDQGFEAAR